MTLVSWFQDEPLLAQVYTAPEWKNRGLATTLMMMSMNALEEKGYQALNLVVTAGNKPAEHVYTKLGFDLFQGGDWKAPAWKVTYYRPFGLPRTTIQLQSSFGLALQLSASGPRE